MSFYYLNSRYYDPYTCRFISADSYVSTGQGFIGNNMFAYCNNNPIMYVDPNGEWGILTFLVVAVVSVVAVAVSANIGTVIASEIEVANSTVAPMDDETFNKILNEQNTSGLTPKEEVSFIRKIRQVSLTDTNPNNDALTKNWSEGQMLRELKYHDRAFRILNAVGLEKSILGERLRYVDFEVEQNFLTYYFRFFGNILMG